MQLGTTSTSQSAIEDIYNQNDDNVYKSDSRESQKFHPFSEPFPLVQVEATSEKATAFPNDQSASNSTHVLPHFGNQFTHEPISSIDYQNQDLDSCNDSEGRSVTITQPAKAMSIYGYNKQAGTAETAAAATIQPQKHFSFQLDKAGSEYLKNALVSISISQSQQQQQQQQRQKRKEEQDNQQGTNELFSSNELQRKCEYLSEQIKALRKENESLKTLRVNEIAKMKSIIESIVSKAKQKTHALKTKYSSYKTLAKDLASRITLLQKQCLYYQSLTIVPNHPTQSQREDNQLTSNYSRQQLQEFASKQSKQSIDYQCRQYSDNPSNSQITIGQTSQDCIVTSIQKDLNIRLNIPDEPFSSSKSVSSAHQNSPSHNEFPLKHDQSHDIQQNSTCYQDSKDETSIKEHYFYCGDHNDTSITKIELSKCCKNDIDLSECKEEEVDSHSIEEEEKEEDEEKVEKILDIEIGQETTDSPSIEAAVAVEAVAELEDEKKQSIEQIELPRNRSVEKFLAIPNASRLMRLCGDFDKKYTEKINHLLEQDDSSMMMIFSPRRQGEILRAKEPKLTSPIHSPTHSSIFNQSLRKSNSFSKLNNTLSESSVLTKTRLSVSRQNSLSRTSQTQISAQSHQQQQQQQTFRERFESLSLRNTNNARIKKREDVKSLSLSNSISKHQQQQSTPDEQVHQQQLHKSAFFSTWIKSERISYACQSQKTPLARTSLTDSTSTTTTFNKNHQSLPSNLVQVHQKEPMQFECKRSQKQQQQSQQISSLSPQNSIPQSFLKSVSARATIPKATITFHHQHHS